MIRLVAARTHIWLHGTIPTESEALWAQAEDLIPDWPGFKRLASTPDKLESLAECAEEVGGFFDWANEKSQDVTFEDKGGGVTHFVVRRGDAQAQEGESHSPADDQE